MTDDKQNDTDQDFRDKVNETFRRIAEETPDPDAKGETPRYSPDDNN